MHGRVLNFSWSLFIILFYINCSMFSPKLHIYKSVKYAKKCIWQKNSNTFLFYYGCCRCWIVLSLGFVAAFYYGIKVALYPFYYGIKVEHILATLLFSFCFVTILQQYECRSVFVIIIIKYFLLYLFERFIELIFCVEF